jgi:hypothetical protein
MNSYKVGEAASVAWDIHKGQLYGDREYFYHLDQVATISI